MQTGEETRQVGEMEIKKKKKEKSAVLVQAVFFLMLGKLELLEFHWLGITEVGHFTKAMWIKLFHTKLSGFWGFSQKLAVSTISNSQTAQQLFIRAVVLQGRWEYQSHSIHTQKNQQ